MLVLLSRSRQKKNNKNKHKSCIFVTTLWITLQHEDCLCTVFWIFSLLVFYFDDFGSKIRETTHSCVCESYHLQIVRPKNKSARRINNKIREYEVSRSRILSHTVVFISCGSNLIKKRKKQKGNIVCVQFFCVSHKKNFRSSWPLLLTNVSSVCTNARFDVTLHKCRAFNSYRQHKIIEAHGRCLSVLIMFVIRY